MTIRMRSDDVLLAGDAAARHYADTQSAASQRRLQQQQQQQQAADMYLDTLQQQQQQQLQDQQQVSMAQSGSSRAAYLQPDGSHVVGPDAASAAYQREAEHYSGSLQQQAQYGLGAAPNVATGFGGEVLSDGLGDLRQGAPGALFAQGAGQYDSDQIMRVAGQDVPAYGGRWPGDDGADGSQYQLGAAGSLSDVDWYDPRQLLAQRQQQQLLSAGYDCGESAGDQGTDVDALPHQTSNWIAG